MVKKFMIVCEKKCEVLVVKYVVKCVVFKEIVNDESKLMEECFKVCLKLVKLLCNSLVICFYNCCQLIGCFYVYYCKFKVFCIVLCELGFVGQISGMVKFSW